MSSSTSKASTQTAPATAVSTAKAGRSPVVRPAFHNPIIVASIIGVSAASFFYLFVWWMAYCGMFPLLIRYAFCHAVAEISVFMFAVAVALLALKLGLAVFQSMRADETRRTLRSLIQSAPQDTPIAAADWLQRMWSAQKNAVYESWSGQRIREVIERQSARGTCRFLEDDLRDLADLDADAQHNGYGFVRIVSWAMPMFGFLGTVIGISQTLGQMDTKALASGSQEAMNSLTSGLYVAFDTTAVGLTLTMAAIFAMFVVNSFEMRLLGKINRDVADSLQGLLCEDDSKPKDIYQVEETIRVVSLQFVAAVENLVEKQAALWQRSIDDAQERWSLNASHTAENSRSILSEALDRSLDRHVLQFERVQAEGAAQLDARYHQWQTTLSEQARSLHSQQTELTRQTELLNRLIDSGTQLRDIEEGLQQNLARLTDIDRFHEAAIILAEGVAVLGTQLERSGFLKPRMVRPMPNAASESITRKAA